MSEKITAGDAVEGQKYTTGGRSVVTVGELVERRPGGGQLRRIVNEHGVHTDVALDYPLWAIDEPSVVVDLVGLDEAELWPRLNALTDAQLTELVDRDGRTSLLEYQLERLGNPPQPPQDPTLPPQGSTLQERARDLGIVLEEGSAGTCSVCGKIEKLRPKHGQENVLVMVAHNSPDKGYCHGGGEPPAVVVDTRDIMARPMVSSTPDLIVIDDPGPDTDADDMNTPSDEATSPSTGADTDTDTDAADAQGVAGERIGSVQAGGRVIAEVEISDGDTAADVAAKLAAASGALTADGATVTHHPPSEPEAPRNPWGDATSAGRITIVKGCWTANQIDELGDTTEDLKKLQAEVLREIKRHKAALSKVQAILGDEGPKTDKGKATRLRARMEQSTTKKRPGVMVAIRIALEGLGEHVPCDGNHPMPPCRDHLGCWHVEPPADVPPALCGAVGAPVELDGNPLLPTCERLASECDGNHRWQDGGSLAGSVNWADEPIPREFPAGPTPADLDEYASKLVMLPSDWTDDQKRAYLRTVAYLRPTGCPVEGADWIAMLRSGLDVYINAAGFYTVIGERLDTLAEMVGEHRGEPGSEGSDDLALRSRVIGALRVMFNMPDTWAAALQAQPVALGATGYTTGIDPTPGEDPVFGKYDAVAVGPRKYHAASLQDEGATSALRLRHPPRTGRVFRMQTPDERQEIDDSISRLTARGLILISAKPDLLTISLRAVNACTDPEHLHQLWYVVSASAVAEEDRPRAEFAGVADAALVAIEDAYESLTGEAFRARYLRDTAPTPTEAPTLSDAEADLVDRFVEEQTKVDESIYSSYRSPPTIIDGMTREQLIAQIDNEPKPSALGKWLAQLPLVMAEAEAAGIRIRIDPLSKR